MESQSQQLTVKDIKIKTTSKYQVLLFVFVLSEIKTKNLLGGEILHLQKIKRVIISEVNQTKVKWTPT